MSRIKNNLTVFPTIPQGSMIKNVGRNSLQSSHNTSFGLKTKAEVTAGAINLDNERKAHELEERAKLKPLSEALQQHQRQEKRFKAFQKM